MIYTTIFCAIMLGYVGGRLHARRIARQRIRAWENGTALRQYPHPELPMDFEAMARRSTGSSLD